MLSKIKTSDSDAFDKVSTHRYSDQTKSTFIKTPQKQDSTAKTIKAHLTGNIFANPTEFVIKEE